jgi:glycosyltransferase involved in cell wall biosynthesis
MPSVSIVIPTRNRAHLLKVALQSALGQTWQDLEILVSDNYCGNEETRKVYESFQDPRLRYVRTDRLLAMPDSWEFALSHAEGDYVTILSDDSYFLSYAIERAMAAMGEYKSDLAAWNTCTYYSPDWLQSYLRNHLSVANPPYRTQVLSSQDVLRDLYELQLHLAAHMPRFLNSICHRRLVARVLQVHGRMFIPPCPDYSAAASLLVNTDNYVFVGWPLGIDGATPFSIGMTLGYGYGAPSREFFAEFGETASFRKAIDLELPTVPVCVAQTLEEVRKSCSPECIPYQVNRLNMLFQSIVGVAIQERNGADATEAWRILDTYIANQPEDIKHAAVNQKRRSKLNSMLRSAVARPIHWLPGWEHLAQLRGRHVFHGAHHHFQNMEQCGQVAPGLIAKVAGLG